ncbi:flavin-containing monooxygenase [Sphingopyxis sp. FD7]|uniref:flavin-containing monooxygenase n=1 Tax=Sphingopyxis sp. FD7 TaxID=1914525 RepID=UPI000DC628F6|nr:NAD(P)/FAD-dependent oxidoreductase [Sphingopyxis sp. FD7]BBB14394.1 phenylacetone monooxygenase [Sphingopyxis sp. FD7]
MERMDVLVIGAGFSGLRALHSLREAGFAVKVIDAADDIGGVWHTNRYPGARCDVESYDYSYMFSSALEQEWRWSERYATQPEILRYIHHVAERFDLRRDIILDTCVTSAQFDDALGRWMVTTERGEVYDAQYLVLAVGQLSTTKRPCIPGIACFEGRVIHSAEWPRDEVDFEGKSVGIIGTGSSGVQMTPVIAQKARRLTVFQRTANFSIPAANAPVSEEEDRKVKANYAARRRQALDSPSGLGFVPNGTSVLDAAPDERTEVLEAAWNRLGFGFALAYKDILLNQASNDIVADFIRAKIAAQVDDPATCALLTPTCFPFGTKRPSVDSGYWATFNRDNVELVDIRSAPITKVSAQGVHTSNAVYPLDILIFATGFDAFTGSLLRIEFSARGSTLKDKWAAGPVTYLGLGTEGFPNMFVLVGPGSPSLLSNVLLSAEQQVDWLRDLLVHARAAGVATIEPTAKAEREWVIHVNERSRETLYPKAASYYVGAEVEGKPRVFMPYSGGVRAYRRILEDVARRGYEGFHLRTA